MRIPRNCPICGSGNEWKQMNVWHEGFSFWKAFFGSWLLGRIGILAGVGSKKKELYHCQACGYTMRYER